MKIPQEQYETMELIIAILCGTCNDAQVNEVAEIVKDAMRNRFLNTGISAMVEGVEVQAICSHAYNGFMAGIVLMQKESKTKQTEELYKMYMGGN